MPKRSVRMPKYPECWSSCGSCASGNVFILELLVKIGDAVQHDDNILTLETGNESYRFKHSSTQNKQEQGNRMNAIVMNC